MLGAAVGKVVARYRRYDDVLQAESEGRLGNALWFIVLNIERFTTWHGAEAARTGANVAKHHESGGAARVAFGPIRTAGILADRFEVELTEQAVRERILVAAGKTPLEPGGQPSRWGGRRFRYNRKRLHARRPL